MRPYPRNSPQAAALIVALTLLADGQLQRAELRSLEALRCHERLGVSREQLGTVLHDLCTDLLDDARSARDDDCRITPALIELLLADVDERALQRRVLALCAGVARADGGVARSRVDRARPGHRAMGHRPAGPGTPRRRPTGPPRPAPEHGHGPPSLLQRAARRDLRPPWTPFRRSFSPT